MKDNSTIKEKSLQPGETAVRTAVKERVIESVKEDLDPRMLLALQAASEKKALDIVLHDPREPATVTDCFLITSGAKKRKIQAIADEVIENLKKSGTPAARVEGFRSAEWILADYGDF